MGARAAPTATTHYPLPLAWPPAGAPMQPGKLLGRAGCDRRRYCHTSSSAWQQSRPRAAESFKHPMAVPDKDKACHIHSGLAGPRPAPSLPTEQLPLLLQHWRRSTLAGGGLRASQMYTAASDDPDRMCRPQPEKQART